MFTHKCIVLIRLGGLITLLSSFQGFSYHKMSLPGPVSVHVLEVDPHHYAITPVHAHNQAIGRQTVQTLAQEHHALAAINGGFFKMKPWEGLPAGILKIDNRWFAWPIKTRAAIGWNQEGTFALVDRVLCSGLVTVAEKKFLIQGINCPRKGTETLLFFPSFHSSTLTSIDSFEVVIRQNRLVAIHEGGNTPIPPDGWVLSFGSRQSASFWHNLPLGTGLDLNIHVLPQLNAYLTHEWNQLPHIVGGTPLLVHNGQIITDFSPEKTLFFFLHFRLSRTAVGLLPNGNWLFVVIDGKQPNSRGVTILELAYLMAKLGCVEALNLDGGGSSTMVVEGQIVNHPYGDDDENLGVSDAILIKAKS